ncbi:aspartyl protease family protein [Rubrolithibacter danxiaensis]|uniref:aspartyl protease family protein n=1 Tax=Rubrolithibacter danxiaensis TaxID=3390805 RepID=UPI003BF7B790
MIEIPLEIINLNDDGFHILVEVVVFGETFKAVIDTGASKTVFDKNIVETNLEAKENLLLSDKLSTGLGTNSMESYTLAISSLHIGALAISAFELAVLDLSMINQAYERLEIGQIIGVVGGDILMEYGAVIHYPLQKLFLRNI